MCLGACGEVGVLLREDAYEVGGDFAVDDRLVDSEFLNEINKK